jgi:phosphoglycolate phosphatase
VPISASPAPPALVVGFDLDMTLVDSADGITATIAAALAVTPGGEHAVVDRDRVWPWVGLPLEATMEALAPDADADLAVREYRKRYATIGAPRTRLLPGAAEAFAAVRAAGGRVLVVSAKAEAGVHEVLAQVGLDRAGVAPDLVVGGLFAAAKGERLILEGATVYVGDHPGDVEAARVAGAAAVAVHTGPQSAESLVAAGADVVLDDLLEFPGWLSAYLSRFSRSRAAR